MGSLLDPFAQFYFKCIGLTLMAVGIAAELHKPAGVAFRQFVVIDHAADRLGFDLRS